MVFRPLRSHRRLQTVIVIFVTENRMLSVARMGTSSLNRPFC